MGLPAIFVKMYIPEPNLRPPVKILGQGGPWELVFYASAPDDFDTQSGLGTTVVEGALDWALNDPVMTPVHSLTQLLSLGLCPHLPNEGVY